MPQGHFIPYPDILPRAREPTPEGFGKHYFFRGKREHSITEAFARLLLPKDYKRVERIRKMKRERIIRERAEKAPPTTATGGEAVNAPEPVEGAETPAEQPPTASIEPNTARIGAEAVDSSSVPRQAGAPVEQHSTAGAESAVQGAGLEAGRAVLDAVNAEHAEHAADATTAPETRFTAKPPEVSKDLEARQEEGPAADKEEGILDQKKVHFENEEGHHAGGTGGKQ